jgi:serine/threonine-protein kinase
MPETGTDGAVTAVAGRFILGDVIGQGGVAVVYRARDAVTGANVALKRLRIQENVQQHERALELFEREFHTLSQLGHPNIVAAHDYGVDDQGPYYSMELLDGGDLVARAPLDWPAACAVARDVCSALSVIHSRRMVFRDLSPRNVRCTSDGTAKLIDFGAMTAMGPTKYFVGTPSVSAPEAVLLQPLDARTDLYSLGVSLYFALVGRRPFPARSVGQLVDLWSTRPALPSALVPGIPGALDSLVMDLMQVDAAHRPASAAEVMARLCAVAGLPMEEERLVSRAYLTTPTMVGCQSAFHQLRESLEKAQAQHGGALLVQGPAGSGRSRFLDACVLAAKVAGAIVLRADSSDSAGGEYGVVRALGRQLLDAVPNAATRTTRENIRVLASVIPDLRSRANELPAPVDPLDLQRHLQPALRDWFLAVPEQKLLVIAVDDIERIDPPSAAVIALLSRATSDRALLVVTTTATERRSEFTALNLIAEASRPIRLERLTETETEAMLRSVFGDVPHVQHVAHRIREISRGRPLEIIQLAQHLVNQGVARYQAGAWSLPEFLDASELPSSMQKAVRARLDTTSSTARELAHAMALAPNLRYSLEECVMLAGDVSTRKVLGSLDELVAADIVAAVDSDYALARQGLHSAILDATEPGNGVELHLRHANLFALRKNDLQTVSHLLAAGADTRAVEVLVQHAKASTRETDTSLEAYTQYIQTLPRDWLEIYDRGVELCRELNRPRSDAFAIHVRVTGPASLSKVDVSRHFAVLFEQLSHDVGLDIFAALSELPPEERLRTAFAKATQRFAETPAHDRCADPRTALGLLGRMIVAGVGSAGTVLSVDLWRLFPSLVPLTPLSPALGVVQQVADGLGARVKGENEAVHELYDAVVQRLSVDNAGLDDTFHRAVRFGLTYVLGTMEAMMGLASSLSRAEVVEESPLHEVNATLVRMLYHLWQGNVPEAERFKARVELLNVERMRPQGVDGAHLVRELSAHTAVDDLTRVKQTLDSIQSIAAKLDGWRPVLHWAKGEYERIRGDFSGAHREIEIALGSISTDGHIIWADAAGAHLKILLAQNRAEHAVSFGLRYLERAESRRLGYACNTIRMPLALALAKSGETERAVALADQVVEYYRAIGSTGLNPFLAHETRARVAASLDDEETSKLHARLCLAQLPDGSSGPARRKYERLVRDIRDVGFVPFQVVGARETFTTGISDRPNIASAIARLPTGELRAKRCLELLLEGSGAKQGFLFHLARGMLVLTARIADHELPASIEARLGELVAKFAADETTTDETDELSATLSTWTAQVGLVYYPVVLGCDGRHGVNVVGVAVLAADPACAFRYPTSIAAEIAEVVRLEPPGAAAAI